MKEPRTTGEHFVALYGHLKGVKNDICIIKNNHLKHMHQDIEKLGGKIDKIYWVLLAAVGTVAMFLVKEVLFK
jgi:hypothetical protein